MSHTVWVELENIIKCLHANDGKHLMLIIKNGVQTTYRNNSLYLVPRPSAFA